MLPHTEPLYLPAAHGAAAARHTFSCHLLLFVGLRTSAGGLTGAANAPTVQVELRTLCWLEVGLARVALAAQCGGVQAGQEKLHAGK